MGKYALHYLYCIASECLTVLMAGRFLEILDSRNYSAGARWYKRNREGRPFTTADATRYN